MSANASLKLDDGGHAVVRVKPLGAGGGGVERGHQETSGVSVDSTGVKVAGKVFSYPKHILDASGSKTAQVDVFNEFMPDRVRAFFAGLNVNVMAYGQTGSGKTHTMFGPPGTMARASVDWTREAAKSSLEDSFGLCPRSVLAVFGDLENRRQDSSRGGVNYFLTASAIELSFMQGNLDLLQKAGVAPAVGGDERGGRAARTPKRRTGPNASSKKAPADPGASSGRNPAAVGVFLDKASAPPRMYGMSELPIESEEDIRKLFTAIASRNTAGTSLNDTSSRSHCFIWLTLRKLERSEDPGRADEGVVTTSRMQFVDLAGSERMDDAHGGKADWRCLDPRVLEGVGTNYSLVMLSQCVRDLVSMRPGGAKQKGMFSFRTYMVDLVPLLSESLSGECATLIVVCVSSAPKNAWQSANALEFGEVFSRLNIAPRLKPENRAKVREVRRPAERGIRDARAAMARMSAASAKKTEAQKKGSPIEGNRFWMIREAQIRDCLISLRALEGLGVP